MSGWIVLAALATIAVTAVLTLILVRLNPPQEDRRRPGVGVVMTSGGGSAKTDAGSNSHDSSGDAGDGGGD